MGNVVAVVSDEKIFVDTFCAALEEQGKVVWTFDSITLAMSSFADVRCSMIVIGVPEPDDRIIRLIVNMKKVRNAPIFVCYRTSDEQQRVVALNNGATACVSQALSVRECSAMIDALLRIYVASPTMQKRVVFSFRNGLVIDTSNWSVWLYGVQIRLTRREYLALRFLAQNENKVLTKKEIFCAAWQTKDDYEIDGSVKTLIKSLRKKLGDNKCKIIQNVRGVGYRMIDDENILQS